MAITAAAADWIIVELVKASPMSKNLGNKTTSKNHRIAEPTKGDSDSFSGFTFNPLLPFETQLETNC